MEKARLAFSIVKAFDWYKDDEEGQLGYVSIK
jgi:hypothetical protein